MSGLECPTCGDFFIPRDHRQRCCTELCGRRLYRRENPKKWSNRSPEDRAKYNAQRRMKYERDAQRMVKRWGKYTAEART